MSTQSQAKERLQNWRDGVRLVHNAHFRAAAFYTQRGRMLSVPVVILTTIVGTAVFTSIAANNEGSLLLQVIAGSLSVAAAVLSSLHASLNYGELAERHRSSAIKYGNLRRDIEQQLCFLDDKTDLETAMKDMRTRWDAVDLEAPEIPQKILDKVRCDLNRNSGLKK